MLRWGSLMISTRKLAIPDIVNLQWHFVLCKKLRIWIRLGKTQYSVHRRPAYIECTVSIFLQVYYDILWYNCVHSELSCTVHSFPDLFVLMNWILPTSTSPLLGVSNCAAILWFSGWSLTLPQPQVLRESRLFLLQMCHGHLGRLVTHCTNLPSEFWSQHIGKDFWRSICSTLCKHEQLAKLQALMAKALVESKSWCQYVPVPRWTKKYI